MDLHVWPASQGIDSFDSDCLVVISYLRLGKCPINLYYDISRASNLENTPLLKHGNNKITRVSKIIEYLRKENYGIEYSLSDEDLARLEALVASVERRITPACKWLLWADYNAYNSYTSSLYRSAMSYFYGLILLKKWRHQVVEEAEFSQLTHCGSQTRSLDRRKEIESSLFEGARRCLTALSYVLGDKNFFFGDNPTAIDAYIFGRLWPLLNYDRVVRSADSNAHRLVAHIYQCENILALCQRVQRLCFHNAGDSFRKSLHVDTILTPTGRRTRRSGPSGWLSSFFKSNGPLIPSTHLRDALLFGALVVAVTTVFAVGAGIVGVSEDDGGGPDDGSAIEFLEEIDE